MSKWLVMALSAVLSFGALAQERYIAGKDYAVIQSPVTTSDPSKVEVMEVFWYGCPHCNNFQPVFEQWKQQQADDVVVDHSPAMWSKNMVTHAGIFYTAKALGKQEEMHKDIFDAMHLQRKKLVRDKEIYPLFAKHGVSEEDFEKAYKSFQVKTNVKRAGSRAKEYGITGTPEVIVNGKYRITSRMTGSQAKMMDVINFLVAKERSTLKS